MNCQEMIQTFAVLGLCDDGDDDDYKQFRITFVVFLYVFIWEHFCFSFDINVKHWHHTCLCFLTHQVATKKQSSFQSCFITTAHPWKLSVWIINISECGFKSCPVKNLTNLTSLSMQILKSVTAAIKSLTSSVLPFAPYTAQVWL